MTEHEQAIQFANRWLDETDPDSDLSIVARQFLRAIEPASPPLPVSDVVMALHKWAKVKWPACPFSVHNYKREEICLKAADIITALEQERGECKQSLKVLADEVAHLYEKSAALKADAKEHGRFIVKLENELVALEQERERLRAEAFEEAAKIVESMPVMIYRDEGIGPAGRSHKATTFDDAADAIRTALRTSTARVDPK